MFTISYGVAVRISVLSLKYEQAKANKAILLNNKNLFIFMLECRILNLFIYLKD